MAKPTKPLWAYGDASFSIEPSLAKKITGWLSAEKPPFQYMNWIHLQTEAWLYFLENKGETISPTMLRSSASVAWSGSVITFASPIDVSFRVTLGEQINRIPAGTINLSDGDVVVLIKDKTNSSPVTVTNGSYATLDDGQYVVVSEASLTANNHENETILFRRKGSNLEIPLYGRIIATGTTFTLGQTTDSSITNGLVPIGGIIPWDDFNGSVTIPSSYVHCDGSTISDSGSPLNGQTTRDLSNRYLVGFGTEGGGDIDTAVYNASPVGNASHQIDLSHSHVVTSHTHSLSSHTHTGAAHTHTGPSHTHGPGSLQFGVAFFNDTSNNFIMNGFATAVETDTAGAGNMGLLVPTSGLGDISIFTGSNSGNTPASGSTDAAGTGATGSTTPGAGGAPSTNTSGATAPGTDTELSATQSIQPRSHRVRFIMRKK
jgi:hypothetical protein